jgi:spermidine synthase
MMRREKLIAYSWNLVGSLLGILLFYFLSFLWAPPSIWILFVALMVMAFLRTHPASLLPSVLSALLVLALLSVSFRRDRFDVYSPYQILTLRVSRDSPPVLAVNNVYYQRILDLSEEHLRKKPGAERSSNHYALPYHVKPKPAHVLIVGSGTGNDVAAALRHGAGEVDAVEIDPAILKFGQSLHPESPYQASNVHAVVDDARAFLRHTGKRYDLIVYGLLDSHTLLASTSGVRLDSFVYTVEAFREARARLKEGGIMSITFALISPQIGRKLFLMLQEAFDGQSPAVYETGHDGGRTFLIGDGAARRTWNGPPGLRDVTAVFADNDIRADSSTDDWPFFYMPVRKYPLSYAVMILVLLSISLVYIRQLLSRAGTGFSVSCFFLGAGFMLVETKGITELALVYGSTWIVIGAMIAGILIMAFLANLLALRAGSPGPVITYGLLSASLIAGWYLSFFNLSALTPWQSRTIMTAVLTLPLFFSGFAFSAELRRSASVALALSSNLLGAMLGGLLEYNSMYFGFRSLYLLALVLYAGAFFGSIRDKP